MKVQILSSPVYRDENGVPAYKSGEWEGSKPNHFGRTRLLLKPILKNGNYQPKPSHKPINEKKSLEFIFKPSKKPVISYFKNIEAKQLKPSRKYIDPTIFRKNDKSSNIKSVSISSLKPKDNFNSSSIVLPKISIKKSNKIERDKNNNLNYCSSDLNLESMMNKKKRILTLDAQRNYFRKISPGDKNYRYSECSPDFYKEGGLIVGSSNRIRISDNYNKLKNDIYKTMDLNVKSLDVNKLWKNKVKKERENSEIDYVSKLEQWEKEYINEDENKDNKNKAKGNNNNANNKKKSIVKEKKKVTIK
jgi:hypothetical protein